MKIRPDSPCPVKGCFRQCVHMHTLEECKAMKVTEKTLLIDDLRNIDACLTARTFEAGIKALETESPFDILYLDHDLGHVNEEGKEYWISINGENYPQNGYGIMCFLEHNPEYLPKKIIIVSSNPVGRKNMQVVIDKLYKKEGA